MSEVLQATENTLSPEYAFHLNDAQPLFSEGLGAGHSTVPYIIEMNTSSGGGGIDKG